MESHVIFGEDTSSWLPTCYCKVEGLGFTGSILGILYIFWYGIPCIYVKRIHFLPGVMWAKFRGLESCRLIIQAVALVQACPEPSSALNPKSYTLSPKS